jgi:hypothetical protein
MRIRKVAQFVFSPSVIVGLTAVTLLFNGVTRAQCDEPVDVPLIRLIAVPEKYNGVLVRTIGFVRLEFEGNVMYPHREDYENALVGNGVWIDIDEKRLKQETSTHIMRYCLIEAIFDANHRGHFGIWSGSLKDIKRFEVWSDPTLGIKRGQSLLKPEEGQEGATPEK